LRPTVKGKEEDAKFAVETTPLIAIEACVPVRIFGVKVRLEMAFGTEILYEVVEGENEGEKVPPELVEMPDKATKRITEIVYEVLWAPSWEIVVTVMVLDATAKPTELPERDSSFTVTFSVGSLEVAVTVTALTLLATDVVYDKMEEENVGDKTPDDNDSLESPLTGDSALEITTW
jgi:hypothetical protein